MKKISKLLAVVLSVMMAVTLMAGCGGKKTSVYGTWGPESVEKDGSSFTISELEKLGDNSLSDFYIVIKEGGQAYVYSGGQGDVVEWSEAKGAVTIGIRECTYDGNYIILENNGIKIKLVKTSDSQSIVQEDTEKETSTKETKEETTPTTSTEVKQEETTTMAETKKSEAVESDIDTSQYPESEGFEFESNNDGTCKIVGIGSCEDDVVVIPKKSPEGDDVTAIGEYALYKLKAEMLIIRDMVLTVENNGFSSGKFSSLIIVNSNITLGESAFAYCEDIEVLLIEGNTIEADKYAFYKAGDDGSLIIKNCSGKLGDYCFESTEFSSVTIEACDLVIGDSGFAYSDNIEVLSIVDSNIEADEYAFYKVGHKAVVLMDNNKTLELGNYCFESCSMASLIISSEKLAIGDSAFSFVEDLTEIQIDGNEIEIDEYGFYKVKDLEILNIGTVNNSDSNTIELGEYSFEYCEKLQSVNIGKGKVELDDGIFEYDSNLVSVVIEGNADIGDYAFYKCNEGLTVTCAGKAYDIN